MIQNLYILYIYNIYSFIHSFIFHLSYLLPFWMILDDSPGVGKRPFLGFEKTSPEKVSVEDYIPNGWLMFNERTCFNKHIPNTWVMFH